MTPAKYTIEEIDAAKQELEHVPWIPMRDLVILGFEALHACSSCKDCSSHSRMANAALGRLMARVEEVRDWAAKP